MDLTQKAILRIAGISTKEEVLMKSIAMSLVTVTAMVVFLGACCGGGTTNVEVPKSTVVTTTTGQQLTDLQKAFDSGAITKEEYDKMRKDIIDKSGK
jgi:hypothetical protein